jgi:hypothetical protein
LIRIIRAKTQMSYVCAKSAKHFVTKIDGYAPCVSCPDRSSGKTRRARKRSTIVLIGLAGFADALTHY